MTLIQSDLFIDETNVGLSNMYEDPNPQLSNDLNGLSHAFTNRKARISYIGETTSNITLDPTEYNYFIVEPTADISININNTNMRVGKTYVWYIEIEGGGDYAISWPDTLRWEYNIVPVLSADTHSTIIAMTTTDKCLNIYSKGAYNDIDTPQYDAPIVEFITSAKSGDAPFTVYFTDQTTNHVLSWLWDFGDGSTSTDQNPSHVYQSLGDYTVKLTAVGYGGSNTITKTDEISVIVMPPVAEFSANKNSGEHPLDIQFTNNSTGQQTSYSWDFGDGNSSTAEHPLHTYTVTGDYTVTLTVTGPGGSDTETKTNYINVQPVAPVANFSADTPECEVYDPIQFTDTSTGDITSWAWDFGDGNTSTEQHPTHTYESINIYDVSLTVTGPVGSDTITKTSYMTVNAKTFGGTVGLYDGIPGDLSAGRWFVNDDVGATAYTTTSGAFSDMSYKLTANYSICLLPVQTRYHRAITITSTTSIQYAHNDPVSSTQSWTAANITLLLYDNHNGLFHTLSSGINVTASGHSLGISGQAAFNTTLRFDFETKKYYIGSDPTSHDMPEGFTGLSNAILKITTTPSQLHCENTQTLIVDGNINASNLHGTAVWIRNDDYVLVDDAFSALRTQQYGITCPFNTDLYSTVHIGMTGDCIFSKTRKIGNITNNSKFSVYDNIHETGFTSNINTVWYSFCSRVGFFDTNTYVGNGQAGHTINHNLQCNPGMVIYKNLDVNDYNWEVWHKSLDMEGGGSKNSVINLDLPSAGKADFGLWWNNTDPDKDSLHLGMQLSVNEDGTTFMYMAFADNPNFASFGQYIGNGSATGPEIGGIGWKPSFVLIKNIDSDSEWVIVDSLNGMGFNQNSSYLKVNSKVTVTDYAISQTSTGFKVITNSPLFNKYNDRYIYMAIREIPCQVPATIEDMVNPYYTGDLSIGLSGSSTVINANQLAAKSLIVSGDDEITTTQQVISNTDPHITFQSRPGFLDMTGYIGNGQSRNIYHSLYSIPQLMFIKDYDTNKWCVFCSELGHDQHLYLNTNDAAMISNDNSATSNLWTSNHTSEQFSIGSNSMINQNGHKYMSFLFGNVPGLTKIGKYTGLGATRPVDCSFTNSVSFVLIKRIDAPGDWYMFSTDMNIDGEQILLLNTGTVVSGDYMDPLNAGFTVVGGAPDDINAYGGEYIYFAIAK